MNRRHRMSVPQVGVSEASSGQQDGQRPLRARVSSSTGACAPSPPARAVRRRPAAASTKARRWRRSTAPRKPRAAARHHGSVALMRQMIRSRPGARPDGRITPERAAPRCGAVQGAGSGCPPDVTCGDAWQARTSPARTSSPGRLDEHSAPTIDPKVYARRWKILAVMSLSLVIIGLDNTILNVALPSLQGALRRVELDVAVDRRLLPARLRRSAADHGHARRPLRAQARAPGGPRDLRRREPGRARSRTAPTS